MIMSSGDIQAQAEIISMLILKCELFKISTLREEYFIGNFKELFKVVKKCYEKNGNIVTPYLLDNFKDTNLLMDVISMSPTQNETTFRHLESYIIQSFKERQSKVICTKFMKNEIEYNIFQNELRNIEKNKVTTLKKLDKDILMNPLNSQENILKVTNFPKIARVLKPCEKDFIVIGGSTGGGKTAFALNLLNDLSKNYPCVYFNLEVAEEEIIKRLIAINTNIKIECLENFKQQIDNVKTRVDKGITELEKRKIYLKTQSMSLDSLKRELSSLNSDKHTIVFIDHMLLINISKSTGRYEKVTDIAIKLREFSIDFNITIIALCQLNRATNYNENSKPQLSSLKESGEIENSASKVMFLYYDKSKKYKMYIAKNRSGSLGEFNLNYDKTTQIIKEE